MTDIERSFINVSLQILATLFVAYAVVVKRPGRSVQKVLEETKDVKFGWVARLMVSWVLGGRTYMAVISALTIGLAVWALYSEIYMPSFTATLVGLAVVMLTVTISLLGIYILSVDWVVDVLLPKQLLLQLGLLKTLEQMLKDRKERHADVAAKKAMLEGGTEVQGSE